MSSSGPTSDWAASDWAVDPARLAPSRRRRKWNHDACQVEGCTSQLEARFHKRHHICTQHLKAPRVAVDGRDMRFCQKCAKFEALEEFEGSKRTCQRALAAHNLARQKRRQARQRSSTAVGSGTGSDSSVSVPAATDSGSDASAANNDDPACAAAAAAGLGTAGAGAAALPPTLRPASDLRLGSRQAFSAGLGEETENSLLLPGLDELLEVPALSGALWHAPGPAQQLAVPAPPAWPQQLASPLPFEHLGSSGSMQATALGLHPAAQQAQPEQLLMLAQQQQQQLLQQQAAHALPPHSLPMAQQAQQQAQQQQAMAPVPTPALLPLLPYVSPGTLHRISLKVFGCVPDELGLDIRAELESMLQVSVEAVEAAIRPGCVHLTADLFLGIKASAAAATVSAAQLLAAVRCPAALGAAAGNAALLQWQGSVAGTQGGTAGVALLPQAEPRLLVHPACIAVPAGQPWPLVQLELQLPQPHAGAAHASDPLAGGTVVCRQGGRHLPVEIWAAAPTEAAALAAADMLADDAAAAASSDSDASSDGSSGSGSNSDAAEPADVRGPLERPWSSGSGEEGEQAAHVAGMWVRPVGLQPGRCEIEVQLPLSGFSAATDGSITCKPVLLSSAAPLLVLPCAAAAAEVRAFLGQLNGQPEAQHVGDWLRDIGTAVGFLWRQQQPSDGWPGSEGVLLPPHFVAAAAAAAAEYAQHAGGMPHLRALLQRAAAAAAAACEGAELAGLQAAELGRRLPSVEAAASGEKSSAPGGSPGSSPSSFRQQQQQPAAADRRSLFDGEDDEERQHCTPAEQLELEAASWGPLAQQARRMPGARWARWAAAIAASFLALLIVRLVLLAAHVSGRGGEGSV